MLGVEGMAMVPRSHMMDEQTYNANFESMRKAPGRRPSKNKQLIMQHKDLQKRCDKAIMKHEFDTRYLTEDIKREQMMLQKKKEFLKKQQQKLKLSKEKNHNFLESTEKTHMHREKTIMHESIELQNKRINNVETEIIKEINKFHMPKAMKERLAIETFRSLREQS